MSCQTVFFLVPERLSFLTTLTTTRFIQLVYHLAFICQQHSANILSFFPPPSSRRPTKDHAHYTSTSAAQGAALQQQQQSHLGNLLDAEFRFPPGGTTGGDFETTTTTTMTRGGDLDLEGEGEM